MSVITSLESLSGLVAFAVTIESGSFAAAGRKLGLSASAVGKAVGRLEQRLGVTLLTRSTRSLALTGEGEVLYQYAARILSDLQQAEQALNEAQDTPRGRLKVSVPTVLGRHIVLPALGSFLENYPNVTVDLDFDDLKVDIVEGGYDLAVRLGDLEDSNLRARRIGRHAFTTCASPKYLEKYGVPETPADLVAHCCIQYRFPTTGRTEIWAFGGEHRGMAIKPGLVLNDGEALAPAAVAGLGIIQAPRYLVSDLITTGRLVPILDTYTESRGDVSIVWPTTRTEVARVRAFINFVAQSIATKI